MPARLSIRSIVCKSVTAACLGLLNAGPWAQTVSDCAAEADDARRLECYDRLFRTKPPATQASPASATADSANGTGILGKFWELEGSGGQSLFAVRPYQPNFFLPLHYSSSINQAPVSPTHEGRLARIKYRRQEAKFQISLRAKLGESLLVGGDGLWLAYTQRSLWQLWNREESSPFRNTDYQPEAIYVAPTPEGIANLPGGWRWPMVQLGFAHQSNGQGDPLSRSWNRLYAGTALENGPWLIQARINRRVRVGGTDDNPDLTRFIGNTELSASWLPGVPIASLTWRTGPHAASRGSLQLDWSYPVSRTRPDGLRWYVQLFSGYGETLIDYNHRQSSIGLGLGFFHF